MVKKKGKLKRFLLILSIMISFLFLVLVGLTAFFYNKYDLDINKLTSVNNGIKVFSASGNDNTLYNTNRSIIEINILPDYVKNAFIDTEDKRFYSHNGYDIKRIIKSAFVNFTNKSKSQGASTISQQLVKNALLTNEKTYSRKVQEIVLSFKMEKEFSKDKILEMYLNTIYFGSNAYGIENASNIYFNKSAKDLTLNEACCLAGLIKSPSNYSPISNYNNSIKRRNLVAKNMLNAGHISQTEYNEVVDSKINVTTIKEDDNSYEKEAIFEACRLLNLSERELINKNYSIYTFKEDDIQNKVIEINNKVIKQAESATQSSLDSLSIVSQNDGKVLAYYANSNFDLHNLKRQPASTLKPLAVYLPCFKHNILSPASMILDEEIDYNGFQPQNADGKFHGFVSCRNALSNSLNIPAVKALDYLGVKKAKESLSNLGINISKGDLNLSLALGAVKNGVKIVELLEAYMTLANYGNYSNLCFVDKILDENNHVVYAHENFSLKVYDEQSCFLVTDILKDSAKTGTAKRLSSLNLPIASKTGTASNSLGNTDLYNIAYTSQHSMITWVADIDNNILSSNLYSSSQPTDINKEICSYLYENSNLEDFEVPKGIIKTPYDLVEMENNHIITQPSSDLDRYIAYDYFKEDNLPAFSSDTPFSYNLNISSKGVIIDFETKKYNTYSINKVIGSNSITLLEVKENNGKYVFKDNDVFSYDEIEYFITNENGQVIGERKKVRPKDYLINLLNQEVMIGKKRWSV